MNGSPVVRAEDDESVVHHACLLQSLGDVVHGLVHGGDHPALSAPIRVVDVGAEVVLVPLRHLHTYNSQIYSVRKPQRVERTANVTEFEPRTVCLPADHYVIQLSTRPNRLTRVRGRERRVTFHTKDELPADSLTQLVGLAR